MRNRRTKTRRMVKPLAILVAVLFMVAMVPVAALATDEAPQRSGSWYRMQVSDTMVDDQSDAAADVVEDDADVVVDDAEATVGDEASDDTTVVPSDGAAVVEEGEGDDPVAEPEDQARSKDTRKVPIANKASNPSVLEFGQTITINTDHPDPLLDLIVYWDVTQGSSHVRQSGQTLTNNNTSNSEQTVVVRHHYRQSLIPLRYNDEYFTFTLRPQTFNVRFFLQDVGSESAVQYGDTVIAYTNSPVDSSAVPALDPVKDTPEGTYTLYSWYTDDTWSQKADVTAPINADTDFYARYASESRIHYVKNTQDAATVPDDQVDGAGNQVSIGGASRSGYALAEWNTHTDGSGDSYMPGATIAMPAEGLTLFAQWAADKCAIHFIYNYPGQYNTVFMSLGGVGKNSRTNLITEIPSRNSEYLFLGWSTDRTGSPQYYPGETINTGDQDLFNTGDQNLIELYAIWGNIADYLDYDSLTAKGETVTYDGQEHVIEGVEEGESDEFPGFLYVGSAGSGILRVEIYADISNIKASGTNAGTYSTPISVPLYTRNNLAVVDVFVFRFEYLPVTNNVLTIDPVQLKIVTDDAEKLYDGTELTSGGTITFGDEEVRFDAAPGGGAVTLVNGETLNIRATGSQTEVGQSENGYEADWGKPEGWGEEASTALRYNYRLTQDVTLGTLTVYYQVDFDENCDSDVEGMPESVKAYDPPEAPEAVIPDDEPTTEHKEFLGWSTDSNATEPQYQPGETIAITSDMVEDGIVTLYAVWTPATHTLTFDPAGGEFRGSTDPTEITAQYGDTFIIPEAPTRDGFTFKYWQGSELQPGDEYEVTQDHLFTAVWEENPPDDPGKDSGKKSAMPGTGDVVPMALLAMMILGGATGMALLRPRRRSED